VDRIANSESGDTSGIVHARRRPKAHRPIHEHVVHVRRIDQTYAELKKRGVEFEGPPQKQPWGTYAMFKDSEGNRFVVSPE